MRKIVRRGRVCRAAIVLFALLALPLVAPSDASAQMREFTGKVDKITGSKIYVDNRMGDKVSFVKIHDTVVEGAKTGWGDVKKNDRVTVHWNFIDKPRKAYKVVVLPPREDG